MKHPYIVATNKQIELAKKRVTEEKWAYSLLDSLKNKALPYKDAELPVFEKDWWEEAKNKPWSETYPEINYHTGLGITPTALRGLDAAVAYSLTEDETFLAIAKRVLLHYSTYDFFAKHFDVGLNWSVWGLRLLFAYDLIFEEMSHGEREKMDDLFNRLTAAVRENDDYWLEHKCGGLFNNHYAWHKVMVGAHGLFYGNEDEVEYTIYSDQGIRDLIENGTRDEGLWFESSLNYHFTAVIPIAFFATCLANAGNKFDLWNARFANERRLLDLFYGPIGVLFPDKTLPTIGDTYGRRLNLKNVPLYFHAYNACPDEKLAWVMKGAVPSSEEIFLERFPSDDVEPVDMASKVWPGHGYVALRSDEGKKYWSQDGYSVFLSYDINSVHSHFDKLNLMAYANGAHIAIDPEAISTDKHAFSSQVQGELNRATLCHNTVMVDEKNHQHTNTKLDLVEFVVKDDLKFATIADYRQVVYPGVKLKRTTFVTGEYILDIFETDSKEEHVYDYLFHTYDDDSLFRTEVKLEPFTMPDGPPWKWLSDPKKGRVDGDFFVESTQLDTNVRVCFSGVEGTELRTYQFPTMDDLADPQIPMLSVRRKAKSTVFVALMEAKKGLLEPVEIDVVEEKHGLLRVVVGHESGKREYLVHKLNRQ